MEIQLNSNDLKNLEKAIEVSLEIFKPSAKEKEAYHNKIDWLRKIENNGLLITAVTENKIVGFSICYPTNESLHIWNVGILVNYRRFGIWNKMYKTIIEHAENNSFEHITLNTYKKKFPEMYSFCLENGFKQYKTKNEKSFFIKSI